MKVYHEIRQYKDDFRVWHSNYKNMSFLSHWHNEIELILVKEGSANITVDGNSYFMNKGDLLIIGSNSLHYNDSYQINNSLEFILFDPDLIIPMDLIWHKNIYFPGEFLKNNNLENTVSYTFDNISKELTALQPRYKKIVTYNLLILWHSLQRFIPEVDVSDKKIGIKKTEKALTYIKNHYHEQISLKDVADHVGLSQSHFSAVFHQFIGINFSQYIQILRIDEAIHMLQGSNRKIIDIALETGFSNIRSFNRVFRNLTGSSPSSFIKNNHAKILHIPTKYNIGDDFNVENDSFVVIENLHPIIDK